MQPQLKGRTLKITQSLSSETDLSVFERHEVVEDGVDGGRDVVEDAGHVHQVLVYRPEDVVVLR